MNRSVKLSEDKKLLTLTIGEFVEVYVVEETRPDPARHGSCRECATVSSGAVASFTRDRKAFLRSRGLEGA